MTSEANPRDFERNRSRALKSRAFRWALLLTSLGMIAASAAILEIVPISVAYWLSLGCVLGTFGAIAVYFVAHQEQRE